MQAEKSTFADFGQRLSALIRDRVGNEAEAARRAGVTPQAINTYVRENRLPKAEQLLALSQVLGVSIEFLLTGSKRGENRPAELESRTPSLQALSSLMHRAERLAEEAESLRDSMSEILFPGSLSADHEKAVRMVLKEERDAAKKKRASQSSTTMQFGAGAAGS